MGAKGLTYQELNQLFKDNNFPEIERDEKGLRFLKVRSLSRGKLIDQLFQQYDIVPPKKKLDWPNAVFESRITDEQLDEFIKECYRIERGERIKIEDDLIDQLIRMKVFDWGGSYQNSLEKNIVDRYVKKIWLYDGITKAIAEPIHESVKGYTLNSWYNHWCSILIEDIFKDIPGVLPTGGRREKVDFFIHDIPFDLKVTYFPDELMKKELKERGFGVELTRVKRKCRELKIFIPKDLSDKSLLIHLYDKLCEDSRAKAFIEELNGLKKQIIRDYENDPQKLKVWFYEEQGEKRFDASNRLFVVLTDENNFFESWKLKRQIPFLREQIKAHMGDLLLDPEALITKFHWEKTGQDFVCKSGIIFINKTQEC